MNWSALSVLSLFGLGPFIIYRSQLLDECRLGACYWLSWPGKQISVCAMRFTLSHYTNGLDTQEKFACLNNRLSDWLDFTKGEVSWFFFHSTCWASNYFFIRLAIPSEVWFRTYLTVERSCINLSTGLLLFDKRCCSRFAAGLLRTFVCKRLNTSTLRALGKRIFLWNLVTVFISVARSLKIQAL